MFSKAGEVISGHVQRLSMDNTAISTLLGPIRSIRFPLVELLELVLLLLLPILVKPNTLTNFRITQDR
jgi:hypothetical protein